MQRDAPALCTTGDAARAMTRFERGRACLITLIVLVGLESVGVALTQTPLDSTIADVLDPDRGVGLVHKLTVDARPDTGLWFFKEGGVESYWLELVAPGAEHEPDARLIAMFPPGADHRYLVRTANAPTRIEIVVRHAPGLVEEGRKYVPDPSVRVVVVEVGIRGQLFSPFLPLAFVVLSLIVAYRGGRTIKELRVSGPVVGAGSQSYPSFQLAMAALGAGVGFIVEGVVRRSFDLPFWVQPTLVFILVLAGIRATAPLARWIGFGSTGPDTIR